MKTVLTSLILLYTSLISAKNLIEQQREEKQIYKDTKITIPSSTSWLERVNKYVTEVLKLSNYEICLVGCDSVLNTIYLVKDSEKEAYSYILEQSSKN